MRSERYPISPSLEISGNFDDRHLDDDLHDNLDVDLSVGLGEGRNQTPTRCFLRPSSWSFEASRTLSRALTCGTPTSHQASPGVQVKASETIVKTVVRSALLAQSTAAPRSARLSTFRVSAPMDSACLAKSTENGCLTRQSLIRLLKLAPPLPFCRRLITAKPPLSQTIRMILWPVRTVE